jgi:hypothetical protein
MTASNVRRLASFTLLALASTAVAPRASAADPTMSDCMIANENASKLHADRKLRQAREQAAMCAAETCPTELHDTCRQRVADLNKAIPTIVFRAKDPSGADLTAVKVTMDGQALAERLEGTAISVDPGQHTFRFETVGQAPVEQTLLIQEGEKERAVAMSFGAGSAAPAPAGALPSSPPASTPSDGSTQRTIGLVVGGVGVAGLVLGTVFGVVALSTKGSHCSNGLCDPGSASNVYSQATISTVGFVAGGILLAGGAVLFFLAPKGGSEETAASLSVAPMVGSSTGGLQLAGRW